MTQKQRKWKKPVLINAVVASTALVAGFFIANRYYKQHRYANSFELLRHLGIEPHGKLSPGTYDVPYGRGRHYIFCRVVGGQTAGSLRRLDIGTGGPDTPAFTFVYQAHDRFHAPTVWLMTGKSPVHGWIDVGLKGRLLFRLNGGNPSPILTRLNGTWVPFGHALGTTFQYKGKYYRYDVALGDWREIKVNASKK